MAHDNDERDEAIVSARIAGTSARALAKVYGCSSREIEEAVDRRLGYALDNNLRKRAIKLNVERLEALMRPFFVRAIKDKDVAAGVLCCKLAERLSLLLGLDSPTRVDVVQLTAQREPSQHQRIHDAIMRVARPERYANNGNGPLLTPSADDDGAGNGNGKVDPPDPESTPTH